MRERELATYIESGEGICRKWGAGGRDGGGPYAGAPQRSVCSAPHRASAAGPLCRPGTSSLIPRKRTSATRPNREGTAPSDSHSAPGYTPTKGRVFAPSPSPAPPPHRLILLLLLGLVTLLPLLLLPPAACSRGRRAGVGFEWARRSRGARGHAGAAGSMESGSKMHARRPWCGRMGAGVAAQRRPPSSTLSQHNGRQGGGACLVSSI